MGSIFPDFFGERLQLTNWTRFSATRFFNSKNVYFADYKGMGVVIKKFAHDHELSTTDDIICKKSKIERPKCRPGNFLSIKTPLLYIFLNV
jgi:hypothetical protein